MNLYKTITEVLFPQRKEELYISLHKMLGFRPRYLEIYRQAMRHKSVNRKDDDNAPAPKHVEDNERLEFLGDAILEAVVSNYLFRKYPTQPEGFLTTSRSKMVRRSTLGQLATKIGLENLVKVNVLTEAHNSYIGGNAFEALVGAIYLDRGYRYCQRFFVSLIERGYINTEQVVHKEQNFKSLILEWSQKYKVQVRFTTRELMPASLAKKPPFFSNVYAEDTRIGRGRGYSKKESHQKAAQRAYQALREHPHLKQHIIQTRLLRQVVADMVNEP